MKSGLRFLIRSAIFGTTKIAKTAILSKCIWFSSQQVTVEAEVIRGEDEEEETKVNFLYIYESLRKQLI